MLIAEFTVKTQATPQAVWSLWADVANWKNWDHEVQFSELHGPFQTGTFGMIKPRGGPKTKFVMLRAVTNQSFHDRSYLPLAQLDFIHSIEQQADHVTVTHRVEMTGALTFFFNGLFGTKIKKGLPQAVKALVAMAEVRS